MTLERFPVTTNVCIRDDAWRRRLAVTILFAATHAPLILANDGLEPEVRAAAPERMWANAKVASSLGELRGVLSQLAAMRKKQEDIWPTQEEDLANERPPPAAVVELEAKSVRLEAQRDAIVGRIAVESELDATVLLRTARADGDFALVEAILPIVATAAKKDPRAFEALAGLAESLAPCPPVLVKSLTSVGTEPAGLLLFDVGLRDRSLSCLVAAGRTGDAAVWARLVALADSGGRDASLAMSAIERIEPQRTASLESALESHIATVSSDRVRAALVTQLGLFVNGGRAAFFKDFFVRSERTIVKAACAGALGRLGSLEIAFLIDQLSRARTDDLRLALVHALGSTMDSAAVPLLIDYLDVPQVSRAAQAALKRVTGQALGPGKASWLRWWRVQPGAAGVADDPDIDDPDLAPNVDNIVNDVPDTTEPSN